MLRLSLGEEEKKKKKNDGGEDVISVTKSKS